MTESNLSSFINELLNTNLETSPYLTSMTEDVNSYTKKLRTIINKYESDNNSNYKRWNDVSNSLESNLSKDMYAELVNQYLSVLGHKAIDELGAIIFKHEFEPASNEFIMESTINMTMMALSGLICNYDELIIDIAHSIVDYEDSRGDTDYNLVKEVGRIGKLAAFNTLKCLKAMISSESYERIQNEFNRCGERDERIDLVKDSKILRMFSKYVKSINSVIINDDDNNLEDELLDRSKKINSSVIPALKNLINEYKTAAIQIPERFRKHLGEIDLNKIKQKIYNSKSDESKLYT